MTTTGGEARLGHCPVLIGVTGHRDLRPEDEPALSEAVSRILAGVARELPHTPLTLLTPLADGADRLVARVALARGIPLVAPLPLPIEPYRESFESDASRKEFDELLAQTERHFVLPLAPGLASPGAGFGPEVQRRQYEELGVFLVRYAQILIALWDGRPGDEGGGTAHVVEINLRGESPGAEARRGSALDPWDRGPCHHVLTPRRSRPEPDGTPFETRLLVPAVDSGQPARERHREILARIDLLNEQVSAGGEELQREASQAAAALVPEDVQADLDGKEREILGHFAMADALSGRMQRSYRRGLLMLLTLVFLALAGFEVYDNLLPEDGRGLGSLVVLAFYPFALGLAFLGYTVVRRREYQDRHLDYRALAEGLRVQIFWRMAGLVDEVSDHYLRKQSGELRWIHEAIRVFNVPIEPDTRDRARLLRDAGTCLIHWIGAQRSYYLAAARRDARRLRRSSRLGGGLYVGSLLSTLGVLVIDGISRLSGFDGFGEAPRPYLFIAIALLLGTSALVRGYSERMGFSEQALQYQRMRDLYGRAEGTARARLERGDLEGVQSILLEVGEEALQENADWVLFRRSRGIELPK